MSFFFCRFQPMQSKQIDWRKERNKNWKRHQLWLHFWDWGGGGHTKPKAETMRKTKSVAFPRLARIHASKAARAKTKAVQSCFSLCEGWSSCWWMGEVGLGGSTGREDGAAPASHRRISLERTHHLCTFVELSLFNPPTEPFGNQLCIPPPDTDPHLPPPSLSVMSALPPLCCCSPVSDFHQSHPTHLWNPHPPVEAKMGCSSLTLCLTV